MKTRKAFTLIELLVVISILVMLMALLLPTAERARKRARAVACLAKLHQWSLVFKMYTDANGGRWFDAPIASYTYDDKRGWVGVSRDSRKSINNWVGLTAPYWSKTPGFTACPMATKWREWRTTYDAFTAWCPKESSLFQTPSGEPVYGPVSYSLNHWLAWGWPDHPLVEKPPNEIFWATCDARGTGAVPVLFDSAWRDFELADFVGPPLLEAGAWHLELTSWPMCINRHDGGVNVLFMDWSARKVGLKELWTLKWYKTFNTAGPWTKAGGVRPQDWPPWMRRFKDY